MEQNVLTFNDLPQVVAQLRDEVMGMRTLYMKLGDGTIPATKPGKRYVLYQDELDKWLEANRKNPIPLMDEEQNAAILASHKRKPDKHDWQSETDTNPT